MNPGFRLRLSGVSVWLMLIVLAGFSVNYPVSVDISANRENRLSTLSQQVLSNLTGPVRLETWLPADPSLRRQVSALLQRYQQVKSDFDWQFHDPETNPETRTQLAIARTGSIFVHYQNRQQRLDLIDETALTATLISLQNPDPTTLVFVEGHGERAIGGESDAELSQLTTELEQSGYRLLEQNLLEHPTLPENTDVVILASPKVELLSGEWQILKNYLDGGGNLIWLTDPAAAKLPELRRYLAIELTENAVESEHNSLYGFDHPGFMVINRYGNHPSTQGLAGFSLFVNSLAIKASANNTWQAAPLWQTAEQEPQILALSLTRTVTDRLQKIVVVGDGDFLANGYLKRLDNLRLTRRLFGWFSERYLSATKITPPSATDLRLDLPKPIYLSFIATFLIFLPSIFIAISFWLWHKRG